MSYTRGKKTKRMKGITARSTRRGRSIQPSRRTRFTQSIRPDRSTRSTRRSRSSRSSTRHLLIRRIPSLREIEEHSESKTLSPSVKITKGDIQKEIDIIESRIKNSSHGKSLTHIFKNYKNLKHKKNSYNILQYLLTLYMLLELGKKEIKKGRLGTIS